eukprot:5855827-Pyramimonas_sp.AAC.1
MMGAARWAVTCSITAMLTASRACACAVVAASLDQISLACPPHRCPCLDVLMSERCGPYRRGRCNSSKTASGKPVPLCSPGRKHRSRRLCRPPCAGPDRQKKNKPLPDEACPFPQPDTGSAD